ncbi:hypothetical protein OPQ81_011648 [Rhizoctonia solani]|nr:hypothetical protein OPQ81_011648 [Rhizoctonia solani]
MSESLKGLAREEVAARRAALTDGRWRNREGIGMYQRSTSNALRNILTGVKGALPSFPRLRLKSRSRSISPKKRAALASKTPVESPKAGPSNLDPDSSPARPGPSPARPGPSPARSARSRRSSIRSRRNSSVASLLSPRARAVPSPARKPPVAKQKSQPKSKSKLKVNKGKEPEPSVPVSPQERRESVRSVEVPELEDVARDESRPDEVEEEEPVAVADPEPDPAQPDVDVDVDVDVGGVEESVVVPEQDHPPPKVSKGKGKAKSRIQEDTVADESVVVIEEAIPEPPPPKKKKSRIQTIVPEVIQRPKSAQSRKASGSKRPAVEDDEDRAEGSPPKRAKNNKGKSKAKAPAKKGKTSKTRSRKKADTIAVESEPEPERVTPVAQDIMVPLQDSPPPRPKGAKRRRYTLMPVRTKEEMAHPDYDPIDCIGWQ